MARADLPLDGCRWRGASNLSRAVVLCATLLPLISAALSSQTAPEPVAPAVERMPEVPDLPKLNLAALEARLEGTEGVERLWALADLVTAYRRLAPQKGEAYGAEVEELIAALPEGDTPLSPPRINRLLTDLSDMAFMTGDYEKTVHWARRALEEAEGANYQEGIAQALWREAVIQGMNLDYEAGLATLERVRIIGTALENPDLLSAYHSAASVVYSYKGRLLDASEAQVANLEYARQGKDSFQLGLALLNMGIEYGDQNPELAEDYLRQALEIFERRREVFYIALSNGLLAPVLHDLGQSQQALELFAEVERYSRQLGDSEVMGRSLLALAEVYFDLGRGDEALRTLDEAVALWGRLRNDVWVSTCMSLKGNYLLQLERPRQALEALQDARRIMEDQGDEFALPGVYSALADAEEALGNYPRAVAHYSRFLRLQADAAERDSQARFDELKARFETAAKDSEIADLQLQQALRQADLQRERSLAQNLLLVAVLLLGLVAVVMSAYRAQRKRRLELQEAYSRLDVAHRTLEAHSEEIRELVREKEELFALAAHDLRAPVVNIRGFSEELRRSLEQVPEVLQESPPNAVKWRQVLELVRDEMPEDLHHICFATQRLESLVDGLLKLYRLSRNELELVPIDVGELTSGLLTGFAFEIEQARAEVRMQPLPLVTADPAALETIFSNLLHNAIKYLDPERPGVIEVSCEQRHGEMVFHVRDNGRGIAAEDLERVFKVFSRVGPKEIAGEGIGLAAVRTLVRRHGGFIWCNSRFGEGSTFSFSLPDDPRHTTVPLRQSI